MTRTAISAPRTSPTSQFELLFKPPFCTFGALCESPQGTASLKSRLTACAMAAIVLTALFYYGSLFVFALTRGLEHSSIRRVYSCVRLVCSTVTMALLIRRSHDIVEFKSRLFSLYSHMPALDPSSVQLGKIRLIVLSTAASVWLLIVYAAFQGFLPDTNETSLAAYFNELWFGLDARRHLSPFVARCFWNFECVVFLVATDVVVYAATLFYVAACFLLRARQQDLRLALGRQRWKNSQSTTMLTTGTLEVLRDLQRLHAVLIETVQQLEDIFSPIVFLAYVACLVSIIGKVYNFFNRNLLYFAGAPGKILWVRVVAIYFQVGIAVWFFLLLSAAAALVNEEPYKTLSIVEKMILDVDDLSVTSSFRASFLLTQFSTPFVRLTAWKVFVISRRFVFTVFGAMLTYGVILLQFVQLGNEPLTHQ